MVSTPNAPDGLFERIEKESEDICLYKRIFLDYTYGIGKIYTAEEIEKAKQSPSFEREYNLKYLGKIGKEAERVVEDMTSMSFDNVGQFELIEDYDSMQIFIETDEDVKQARVQIENSKSLNMLKLIPKLKSVF